MVFLGGNGTEIITTYSAFMNFIPLWAAKALNLFLIAIVLVLYSIAIWKFYRFIAKKNLIQLNLKQYNYSEHPLYSRTTAIALYTLEYIIILPFITIFWYIVFVIFMFLVTQGVGVNTILIISAAIIIAIRMTAYYKEDLSKDLAKMLPFTILGIALERGGITNFQNILSKVYQIPDFFKLILVYIIVIFVIEVILRVIEDIFISKGLEGTNELEN